MCRRVFFVFEVWYNIPMSKEQTPKNLLSLLGQILVDLEERGVTQVDVDGEIVMWDNFVIYLDETRPILQINEDQVYAKTGNLVQEIYGL